MIITTNKIGSVLKNVKLKKKIITKDTIQCKVGEVVAVKVIKVNQKYNKLELFNGRQVVLTEGDVVLGCLGNRMASAGMTGVIPKDLKPFDRIHILNIGGLIGQCKDFNILLGGPTECEVIGSIVDNKNKNINIDQFKKLKITNKLKTKTKQLKIPAKTICRIFKDEISFLCSAPFLTPKKAQSTAFNALYNLSKYIFKYYIFVRNSIVTDICNFKKRIAHCYIRYIFRQLWV